MVYGSHPVAFPVYPAAVLPADLKLGIAEPLGGDPAVATHYRHCADLTVQQGQRVAAGQQIGTVGRTGMATGPCLSFAVYQQGVACDPLDYLETE